MKSQTPSKRALRRAGLPLKAAARVWLEQDGAASLGQGRIELLEALDRHGSITQAAQAVGISYRAAWRWIDRANGFAASPLVVTATGGAHGGGAQLTPAGKATVAAFRLVEKRVAETIEQANLELERLASELSGAR